MKLYTRSLESWSDLPHGLLYWSNWGCKISDGFFFFVCVDFVSLSMTFGNLKCIRKQ